MVRFNYVAPCGNNCKSTCKVKLYQGYKDQGVIYNYDDSGNVMGVFENHTSSYTGTADENCMMTGFTWYEGKNPGNSSGVDTGNALMLKDGYENLHARGSQGHGESPRDNWFKHYDNIDGLRFQTVPSAPASKWQYHITIPPQKIHDFNDPKKITKDVYHSDNSTFNPCPGASAKYFNSKSGVRCIYPKTADALKTLKNSTQKSNMGAMYTDLVGKFCADSNNIFKSPGDKTCLELTAGRALAVEYCKKGANIKGALPGGDPNCSADLTSLGDSYGTVAKAFCEDNPDDSFCSCYNVVENKCADDKITGVAGCNHSTGKAYVKLREATPVDFRPQWDGQRKCGSVCTGDNIYIPNNDQAGCKTTIQICKQDITVGSMQESDIKASCELNASDGSSVSEPPSSSQLSAQEEIDEAKAALARGDPGAQEKLDAAEAALDAADEAAGETGPKAYIPKSLDGLKNDRKQQIGAGVMGALVLGCMMLLLLIVAGASGGGGGGPVARRFSR